MTQRSVLTAPIVAIVATLLLPATAAAAPDLSGKSPLYVSTYRASYVTCLEKSVGRKDAVAYCEAQAVLAAQAAEAKRSLVTVPTGPVQTGTPTGPISTVPVPTTLPTEGIREVQQDREKYADYDLVVRVPVKITNFRKHERKTIENSQPRARCYVSGDGFKFSKSLRLSKVLAEGDSHEEVIVITLKKDESLPEDQISLFAHCTLVTVQSNDRLCGDRGYEQEKSFCYVRYNSTNNKYQQE